MLPLQTKSFQESGNFNILLFVPHDKLSKLAFKISHFVQTQAIWIEVVQETVLCLQESVSAGV